MASYSTNEFRGGLKIILDGEPFTIDVLTSIGDPVRENGAVMLRSFLGGVGVDVGV